MKPVRRNSSLLGNDLVNTFTRKRMRNGRRAVFSVVHVEFVATQRCGTHISAAVNQHATIEETVFSVGAASRLYNEDLRQLRYRTEGGYGGCSRG
jgi:hypothetical protein